MVLAMALWGYPTVISAVVFWLSAKASEAHKSERKAAGKPSPDTEARLRKGKARCRAWLAYWSCWPVLDLLHTVVCARTGDFLGGKYFFFSEKPGLGLVALCLQPPSVTLQPPSVTLQPPSVALQPPSVALQPPSVTLQPLSVTFQPPSVTLQPPSVALQPLSVAP